MTRRVSRWHLLLAHALMVQLVAAGARPSISYALIEIGRDGVWLGVAAASFAIPPIAFVLPLGRCAERWGERVVLVAGGVFLTTSVALALLARENPVTLLISAALLGMGIIVSVLGEQVLIMRTSPAHQLDRRFGLYTFMNSAGQMTGPLLLLIPHTGSSTAPPLGPIFATLGAIAALCTALSAIVAGPRHRSPYEAAPQALLRRSRLLLATPGMASAMVSSSLVVTSLDILVTYLPSLANERGLSVAWVSAILFVRGLCSMVSRLALSEMTHRWGRRRVMLWGSSLSSLAMVVVVLPAPPMVLLIVVACYGFAMGTVQPLTMSWVTLITPPHLREISASVRLLGNRIGQSVLPVALSPLALMGGSALVFAGTGASLAFAALAARGAPDS